MHFRIRRKQTPSSLPDRRPPVVFQKTNFPCFRGKHSPSNVRTVRYIPSILKDRHAFSPPTPLSRHMRNVLVHFVGSRKRASSLQRNARLLFREIVHSSFSKNARTFQCIPSILESGLTSVPEKRTSPTSRRKRAPLASEEARFLVSGGARPPPLPIHVQTSDTFSRFKKANSSCLHRLRGSPRPRFRGSVRLCFKGREPPFASNKCSNSPLYVYIFPRLNTSDFPRFQGSVPPAVYKEPHLPRSRQWLPRCLQGSSKTERKRAPPPRFLGPFCFRGTAPPHLRGTTPSLLPRRRMRPLPRKCARPFPRR
jgi:hypothetical protein